MEAPAGLATVLTTSQRTLQGLLASLEGSQCSDQRPMVIGETIGWKALTAELPNTPSPQLGVQCLPNEAMAIAK